MNPAPSDPGFEILFEDEKCLVIVKPGGVLTQAPPGIDSLELRVKTFLKRRDGRDGRIYLGVPHRLDRPVAGVMILGKNRKAARRLSEQFGARLVRKTYWAVVEGSVSPADGTWSDYVRKVPGIARSEVVDDRHVEGRLAILHYRTLAALGGATHLEIELETGRTHQIRVQVGSRGHAILGDKLYGAVTPFGPATPDVRERRIALLARSIEFHHPKSREWMRFEAPLPPEWRELDVT
jgi:RluA family pseudouridine synthase